MGMLKLYKSGQNGCKYIFEDGHEIFFRDSRYATSDPEEVKQLDKAVKVNFMLFVDPEQPEIEEEEYLTPVKFEEKKVLEKYGIDPSVMNQVKTQADPVSAAKALGAATSIDLASIIKQ